MRSTHGVNCTGSCSWNVYVKDGLITWETQAIDYPSNGPDDARLRAARLPARRVVLLVLVLAAAAAATRTCAASLLEMFREARARLGDPVEAWAEIVEDPEQARGYKSQRGKGGFVRASWEEAAELIAAAHVHTIRRYGPDRVVGFSPIPAMSMVSYAAGHAVPVADRRRHAVASTTGTRTCRRPRRRSSATRPTCPSRPTGGTPAT